MTDTEEQLQNHLDKTPHDHQARGILADHLDDIGDPRTNGYRALGGLQKYPLDDSKGSVNYGHGVTTESSGKEEDGTGDSYALKYYPNHTIPDDWFSLLQPLHRISDNRFWRYDKTRKELEDRLATQFNQLPEERQHELLGLNEPRLLHRKLTNRRKMYKKHVNR